ncbi:MAG TPA: patatin-like phospholipase family protein, partial [Longimicrobiales bacterium]
LVCVWSTTAHAQEALVLSGGGGRGLAHAGEFFVLQERGYDPDIVIGTSMGAVVGALYAAGYEPEEIRRQLRAVNWRGMFLPTPVLAGLAGEIRYPMFSLDLDVTRLRASRGLVGQWRINRALAQLLFDANARSRGEFDRLPRRYRAVAADLTTGAAVVLERGDIALAARASMAVPGFFAPVHWNDVVLVDGGIADNLPTGVARRMGARRVIASDVGRAPPRIRSEAPFAVVGRALDLMEMNTRRDTVRPDVLILPDIPASMTAATFPDDPSSLIEIGIKAARRDLPIASGLLGRGKRVAPALPDSFSQLIVEAPDSALAALARAMFRKIAPAAYNARAVSRAVDHLYTTGLVEAVWPRVAEQAGEPFPALVVRLDGPPAISLTGAASYETDRGGRAWASLDRFSAHFGRPAVQTIAGSLEGLGRWASLSVRVYSLGLPGMAYSGGGYARQNSVRFFDAGLTGTQEVFRAGGWLALDAPLILRERGTTLSMRAEWINIEGGASGFSYGPMLRWAAFESPSRIVGVPVTLEAERRWGTVSYSHATVAGSYTFRLGALQVAPLADVRAVTPDAPPDVQPSLGEQHLIPGLRWGEDRSRARVAAGIDAAYPLLSGFLRVRARAGTALPELRDAIDSRWRAGVQGAAVWPTPLGTIDIGYGVTATGQARFDVVVGARF